MKLVKYNDPILYEAPARFDFNDPPMDPVELADNLKNTMVELRGVGLSANQVGIPYQVFAAGDFTMPEDIIVAFNPRIVFVYLTLVYS